MMLKFRSPDRLGKTRTPSPCVFIKGPPTSVYYGRSMLHSCDSVNSLTRSLKFV